MVIINHKTAAAKTRNEEYYCGLFLVLGSFGAT